LLGLIHVLWQQQTDLIAIKKMIKMKKTLFTTLAILMAMIGSSDLKAQDLNFPRPSPTVTVKQQFATSFVELSYSRPSVKGRKIFGELVSYDEIWRTGANAATTIEFGQNVSINGKNVEKGKYGLLTIPGENEWTIIITKDLNVTSPKAYKKENDVVRIASKVQKIPNLHETFTIEFSNVADNEMQIEIKWEFVQVSFAVKTDFHEELMKNIETAMGKDSRPYSAAASYYLNNNGDLNKALVWIDKALEQYPAAYWNQLTKAKILFKLKRYNEAVEASELSKKLAVEAGNKDYIKVNDDLIKEIKSQPDYKETKKKK
jgi:tetratricopeptide (TPR) repeat protein